MIVVRDMKETATEALVEISMNVIEICMIVSIYVQILSDHMNALVKSGIDLVKKCYSA